MIVQWFVSLLLLVLAWLGAMIAVLSFRDHGDHATARFLGVVSIVCLLAGWLVRP